MVLAYHSSYLPPSAPSASLRLNKKIHSTMKTTSFGSWKSPITSDSIVASTIGLPAVTLDGEDIYWLETRPNEGGRNVLVKHTPDGKVTDVTPPDFNVRTKVHEYGGGAFLVVEGTVYFSNFADGRIYRQTPNTPPQPLTKENKLRYADFILDWKRNRLICVCEDHREQQSEPENTLIGVDLSNGTVQVLVSGSDFYSSPRLSPDGNRLAWLSWNHPHMPWDSSELWLSHINEDGTLSEEELVAGGPTESVGEPKWSPDGILYFSSDRLGWWHLYRRTNSGKVESLSTIEGEFAYPHWVFGISTYGFASSDQILCTYTQNGSWHLASLNLNSKELQPLDCPYTNIWCLQVREGEIVFIGGSPTETTGVVSWNLSSKERKILKRASTLKIEEGYLSVPEAIAFPTEEGKTAYGWYYPPKNKDYLAPTDSLPPMVVKSHGGPTAAASSSFNLKIQYWTSRGFAFLDVNYGGSTGYGREYRERLAGKWGIVDVDDCVNGAKYLVEQGKVDGKKLAITGSSAGGYTTLAALTFRDVFQAGASYYGISDLEALVRDTHKFESRYLDKLIGPYPEMQPLYQERSPIHFTHHLSCPIIFFQGLEDKVVPPPQAEMMVKALQEKGLNVVYVPFPGEQHGFRRGENIKKAIEAELNFYHQIFSL